MWRDHPVTPGDAVCVDIDGVLADASHRQHYLEYHDWDTFFVAATDDTPFAAQVALLDQLDTAVRVALVTSRPEWVAAITSDWLKRWSIRWDLLIMRNNWDYRPAPQVKTDAVIALRDRGFTPVLAFDDDQRNVDAYTVLDVPCVYIHSGYHPL